MTVFTEKRLSASSVGIDKGGSNPFQGSIPHRLFSVFRYTSEARSLHPKENSSPPVLATIHQNAATWGWGRGVAGCHSLWVHCRVIASVPRATLRHRLPTGSKVGQIHFRVWYSIDYFSCILEARSLHSKKKSSLTVRATIHQNAAGSAGGG